MSVRWLPEAPRTEPLSWLGVELPSERSAAAVVAGQPGSLGTLLLHALGRAAVIGAGLAIVGARGKDLLEMSFASAGAIELLLLAESLLKKMPLPTGENATDVVRGEPGSLATMLGYTAARAALIGVGVAATGVRDARDLVRYSLAGSAAVEAFVLSYAWYDERKKR